MDDTQKKQVLFYLRTHHSGMTSMDAFNIYQITRLAAVVFELRQEGYNIITINEVSDKTKKKYARYILR